MRILYSHYLTADDHPAARMVQAVAGELRALGHDVFVHRSAGDAAGEGPAAPAARRRPGPARRLAWFAREMARNRGSYRRDREAVRAFRPDVVLARQDAYRWSMPRACARAGAPLVTYADAPVAYESRHVNPSGRWHPPGLPEAIERWGLARGRAAIAVSRTAARLLGRYGLDVPVHVVPNGVDVEAFRPTTPADRQAVRREWGVATPHVAGFVGTFQPFHGLHLLRELILATAGRADLTWLLVGDGAGRAELERAVAGRARVVFTGSQPRGRVAGLLGATDVLVLPRQDAVPDFYFCPLKVLEAMAAGTTCLAGDQGDVPDLLDGGRAGRLVSTDRPEDWARLLCGLLDCRSTRAALGEAGRARAHASYTWRRTAEAVAAVLDRHAAGPPPRRAIRAGREAVPC